MATIQLRTDDITGETLPEDTPTTRIYVEHEGHDISIEIDLSDTSLKTLLKALDKYVSKGRPVVVVQRSKPAGASSEAARARAWAMTHRPDLKVNEKGQLPDHIRQAYREFVAQGEDETPEGQVSE